MKQRWQKFLDTRKNDIVKILAIKSTVDDSKTEKSSEQTLKSECSDWMVAEVRQLNGEVSMNQQHKLGFHNPKMGHECIVECCKSNLRGKFWSTSNTGSGSWNIYSIVCSWLVLIKKKQHRLVLLDNTQQLH